LLYRHAGQISKAPASPKRLESLDLLSKSAETLEVLALVTAMHNKLTRAHLRSRTLAGLGCAL